MMLSACGTATQVIQPQTPPTAGADDIVWQVTYGAGFISLDVALSVRPVITLYGDGRYFVQPLAENGVSPTVVTTFDEGQLSPAELTAVREAIAESHVFDHPGADLGDPAVMDAGITSVQGLTPGGTSAELHAYALGIGGLDTLTTRQADLRTRLDALIGDVDSLIPDHGSQPYEAERLEVLRLDQVNPVDDPRPSREWPGPSPRTMFAGQDDTPACAVISGSDVADVLDAAQHNPGMTWTYPAGEFRAVVTIALPGDEPCAR